MATGQDGEGQGRTGESGRPNTLRVVLLLGFMQILAWGTTYYLPAVLAVPIARDMGWSVAVVVGGLSWGLVVSGLLAPRIGRLIDDQGGRRILGFGSVLMAAGLAALGLSTSLVGYYAAWTILGVGLSAGLYDAAFATLGRYFGSSARPAITGITLLGGLASTAGWPALAALNDWLGWRDACFVVAAVHLFVGLPVNGFLLPRAPVQAVKTQAPGVGSAAPISLLHDRQFLLLATAFTLYAAISSGMSVHILEVLRRLGADPAVVIGIGMVIGPAQVGARIIEFALGRRSHPIWIARVAIVLTLIALFGILALGPAAAIVAMICYGAGNGIMTIARGALPLAMFGAEGYGARVGAIARPVLIVQALAPTLLANILEGGGASGVLWALSIVALGTAIAFGVLRPRQPPNTLPAN